MQRRLWQLLCLTLLVAIGAYAFWPVRESADEVPSLVRHYVKLAPGPYRLLLHGNMIYYKARDTGAEIFRLVGVDIRTQKITVLADNLEDFVLLAVSDRRIALDFYKQHDSISVFDLENRTFSTHCCFENSGPTQFLGDTLRTVYVSDWSLSVTTVNLVTGTQDTRVIARSAHSKVMFWGDNIVIIDSNRSYYLGIITAIYVFHRNLNFIDSGPIPNLSRLKRGKNYCGAFTAAIDAGYLVYVTNCGQINIFNLQTMRLERTLPYFSDATQYSIAVADGLIFAAPHLTLEPVTIFNLADGKLLDTLPIVESDLAAIDGKLVALTYSMTGRTFAVHEFDSRAIRNQTKSVANTVERCGRADSAIRNGGSVQDGLDLIEAETVAPLIDELESLGELEVACARIYARLLARTIDRIPEGIALLERLLRGSPGEGQLTAYLTAARTRLAIHDGTDLTSSEQSRNDSVEVQLPSTALREMTLGANIESQSMVLKVSDDRVYLAQAGDLDEAGTLCAALSFHDRADLHLETTVPIAWCDTGDRVYVTSVVEGPGAIYVALQEPMAESIFSGPEAYHEMFGWPDLIAVHKQEPTVIQKWNLMGGILRLAHTTNGLITCRWGHCLLRDPDDLKASAQQIEPDLCWPKGRFFPGERLPRWLLGFLRDRSLQIVACNQKFAAVRTDWGKVAQVAFYRADAPERSLAVVKAWSPTIAFLQDAPLAVISSSAIDHLDFFSVDLDLGHVRAEVSLHYDRAYRASWAVYRNFLLIGRDRDLIVYDLERHTALAYLKYLFPVKRGDGETRQNHQIADLVVDDKFDRLIALTFDGHYSQLVSLPALMAEILDHPPVWQQMEQVLASE